MDTNIVATLFPGIASLFVQDPVIAGARIALIIFGFFLAYLGFKRTLEPLIMVPMGIGMICINCGVLFLDGGKLGTLFLDPLISEPGALVDIMQINFLQPIYNLTFSNSLVACLVFMGVGAMCEISFILANPWTSIIIAIFAEAGTFVTLILGVHLGLTPPEAAAVASIGGADGPMVLFTSLMLAPHLFVPISVIAYLYLSLTYAGYPALVKMLVPKKYRGNDIWFDAPEVPKTKKFIFILVCCALLCILLLSVYVLHVPVAGSLPWLVTVSLLFIFVSLSLGLLISTLTQTQVAAMLVSGLVLMMPTMLLSGMIFPVESMPWVLQGISAAIPARWYIQAVRKLMIQGVDVVNVLTEVGVLLGMAVVLVTVSLKKFKNRLE